MQAKILQLIFSIEDGAIGQKSIPSVDTMPENKTDAYDTSESVEDSKNGKNPTNSMLNHNQLKIHFK